MIGSWVRVLAHDQNLDFVEWSSEGIEDGASRGQKATVSFGFGPKERSKFMNLRFNRLQDWQPTLVNNLAQRLSRLEVYRTVHGTSVPEGEFDYARNCISRNPAIPVRLIGKTPAFGAGNRGSSPRRGAINRMCWPRRGDFLRVLAGLAMTLS